MPPVADEPAKAPRRQLRVLVVDDNREAVVMLSSLIRRLGNEVRTAEDGLRAVEMASQFRPHVVIMDLGMPKMNGYEAAEHIRLQTWGERMRLIALTGWGQEECRERTRAAGFDDHLVKPVERAAIEKVLASAPVA